MTKPVLIKANISGLLDWCSVDGQGTERSNHRAVKVETRANGILQGDILYAICVQCIMYRNQIVYYIIIYKVTKI